ncbi:PREDICTED: proton-coupled amino acid transporter-like protein CG1139 isoform X2 [Nicrophorus vespilloides]|nr:PREDICTED: proton-coupled amino acid transporter-like protein CG1139 isoform X2 [Nicrophorus vespilloides]
MSSQQTNLAFEPDDAFTKCTNDTGGKTKKDLYTLDVKDTKSRFDEYDPYEHRTVERPTTNTETLLHLLKGSLGTGILAMPKAFHHSGYIFGLVGTIIIGLICTYCIHLLVRAEYVLCKRKKVPSMTYPTTVEEAFANGPLPLRKFAPYSGHMVNAFLLIYQIGTCCVYIVFIAENIQAVQKVYSEKISLVYLMLMFLLPLILLNWVRNLKLLAPFSTLANLITLVSFGIVLYFLIDEGPTFKDREPLGEVENLPLFFGTVLFALEAIGVIMPLENEMKTPKSFGGGCGVLNSGMFTIIFLYVGMGLLGYLTYGEAVEGTITTSLPVENILAQVVMLMLALAIFITYALQCYVAVDITWNEYLAPRVSKGKRKLFYEYCIRTLIVLITFGIAAAVPELDLFISLFGALCLSALGIAIPALVDMCTYWHDYEGGRFYFGVIKNLLIVTFGIFGLIVGTYTSLSKIVDKFNK